MALLNIADQYHTYEGRLNSFLSAQPLSKRRTSSASSKAAKSQKWPHSFLSPEKMANAGFFHYPTDENPDNTICFLCLSSLDGWEQDDDPLVEHLKHSPNCGWAIVASIEARDGELRDEYPLSARMIEARRATFGDRWPHEDKKGWKCKVKKMVDAGWKYTPTPEYDDMATCAYCELALDGWEPSDKPLDEHRKRSPDCPFFTLLNSHENNKKASKSTKAGKPRASKASRVSTQSIFTVASEAPSVDDLPAEEDDSIVTTATNVTVTSQVGRKMAKGKKPAKGRKAKTKKDEPVEASSLMEPEDDDFEVKVEQPKVTRGKKRGSEAVDGGSSLTEAQPPPAKRRGTRTTRGSVAASVDTPSSPFVELDVEMTMAPADDTIQAPKRAAPKGKRGRPSNTKTQRSLSTASKASLRVEIPDDDEIDRALQADLERPLTDEEADAITIHVPKSRQVSRGKKSVTAASAAPIRTATRPSGSTIEYYDMFTTGEISIDEAVIEAELEAMEVEEPKPLPKAKGAKGKQPRKPSAKQQAAAKRAAEAARAGESVEESVTEPVGDQTSESNNGGTTSTASPKVGRGRKASNLAATQKALGRPTRASSVLKNDDSMSNMMDVDDGHDSGHESDASMASQSTVIVGGAKRRVNALKKRNEGKKATSRNIEEIIHRPVEIPSTEEVLEEAAVKKPARRAKKVEGAAQDTTLQESPEQTTPEPSKAKAIKTKGKGKALPDLPAEEEAVVVPQIKQPLPESPKQARKQLTPSLSPQSSDAENQPPSSKPSILDTGSQVRPQTNRIPLQATTPSASPSKRNIIAGHLQISQAWSAIDLDEILLKSPSGMHIDQENSMTALLGDAVNKAKTGELTSPEKKMTVEEWIVFNARLAEEKLRSECERMVGIFERAGGRAVGVLEGLIAE